MRKSGLGVLLVVVCVSASSLVGFGWGDLRPSVIYGEDNRLDVYDVQDSKIVELSRSTVALVYKNKLKKNGKLVELATSPFGKSRGYCKDERFYEQPTGAFCSGFLVGPNLIATAGHCVEETDCEKTAFVFDFLMENEGTPTTAFRDDQVYHCKRVIERKQVNDGADYALVEVDREVEGDRRSLVLRESGELDKNDGLILMGHPSGLPLKIADGASLRKWGAGKSFFVANTDSYGGNSGSAVLNARTLEVEGILVRGETDFEYDWEKRCTRSVVCEDGNCRGEDVTAISYIAKLLKSR